MFCIPLLLPHRWGPWAVTVDVVTNKRVCPPGAPGYYVRVRHVASRRQCARCHAVRYSSVDTPLPAPQREGHYAGGRDPGSMA